MVGVGGHTSMCRSGFKLPQKPPNLLILAHFCIVNLSSGHPTPIVSHLSTPTGGWLSGNLHGSKSILLRQEPGLEANAES